MQNEVWKPIAGYEGFYEVSSLGRVRSLDRTVYFRNGKGQRDYKGKILRRIYRNDGYPCVNLVKNNYVDKKLIHRLVAQAFIDNPDGLPVVNHISGVKSDCSVGNLEWCTSEDNNRHAKINGLMHDNTVGLQRINESNRIPVRCIRNDVLLYEADDSRSMATWLIENGYTHATLESCARSVRRYCQTGKLLYGCLFKRYTGKEYIPVKDGRIVAYDQKGCCVAVGETSNNIAKLLLDNGFITNAQSRTVARRIRKIVDTNIAYHNLFFKYSEKPVQTIS